MNHGIQNDHSTGSNRVKPWPSTVTGASACCQTSAAITSTLAVTPSTSSTGDRRPGDGSCGSWSGVQAVDSVRRASPRSTSANPTVTQNATWMAAPMAAETAWTAVSKIAVPATVSPRTTANATAAVTIGTRMVNSRR